MNSNSHLPLENINQFDNLLQTNDDSSLITARNIPNHNIADIRHGFKVGSYGLLVPKAAKTEVIYATTLCPLPNTPSWFSGFVNYRGEALPIFYLEALFNPKLIVKKNKQWILFLEQQQKICGILMNECPYKLNHLTEINIADFAAISEQIKPYIGKSFFDEQQGWLDFAAIPEQLKPYVEKSFFDGQQVWLDFAYHPFLLSLKSAF